jgi:hypothetical protein
MLLSSSVFLGLYGLVMGMQDGGLQALSSLVKLPALFLITLLICIPSLHFFNILFGSKQSARQSIALGLTAITTTAVLLFSLAPITLFFMITGSSYVFYKLLNVLFFFIAGWTGLAFLRQGSRAVTESEDDAGSVRSRRVIFWLWLALYGFVGTQMAWTLSPFVGDPDQPFILFRHAEGNFYVDVVKSILLLVGG